MMQDKRKKSSQHVPTVGFLAARFDEAYQYAVWSGAADEAKSLGISLVFFGGQRISSPIGYEALDNIAFDLAKRCDIEGLIVMSNVIGTYISNKEQADFLHHFHDKELVTIGVEFKGIEAVCVDPSGGMSSIVEHLVHVHGRKRFLFLAGPKGHIESDERKAEFLQRLSCLLPEAKPSIVHGDFTDDDACARVNEFLDAGGTADAIVAANDQMAFGALASLSAHGLSVPSDVSLTGFDDTEDSRFSDPSLTTVRQPVAILGHMAMRHMAAKLGLVPKEPSVRLPVSCIIRESCGCRYSPDQEETRPGGSALPLESGEEKLPPNTEQECRHFVSQRLIVEKRAAILSEIEASLISSFSMEDILREIARSTRELGISSCWLSLFDSSDFPPVWSRLFLAADKKTVRILVPQGMCFRTAELVPGGLPEKWDSYVCEPLCFGNDRLGYLICTADSTDRRMYAALRDQVSSSKLLILFLINIFLLLLGMVVDPITAILLVAPLFFPLATGYLGLNPVHFGILVVTNLAVGLITPPMAGNLFVAMRLSGASIRECLKPLIPFVLLALGVALLVTYSPTFALCLVRALKGV